jgi:hypothetical protein
MEGRSIPTGLLSMMPCTFCLVAAETIVGCELPKRRLNIEVILKSVCAASVRAGRTGRTLYLVGDDDVGYICGMKMSNGRQCGCRGWFL